MFSVVLATHNEASNITACLQAIKKLADEIIVVDGASSDDTVKQAEKLGARVISTTNKANFHINKQQAIDAARGDLILQLDADEIVDEELFAYLKELHHAITTTDWNGPVAWYLKRKNFFLGRFLSKGGQYPDPVIRVFIRGKARLPQKDVHEQMIVDGAVATAEGHLLHYGNPTFADYVRKFNTYTSFSAQQNFDAGVRITIGTALQWFVLKPISTFFKLYIRHRGYVDGMAGFVFALMSGLHFPVSYLKLWELTLPKETTS